MTIVEAILKYNLIELKEPTTKIFCLMSLFSQLYGDKYPIFVNQTWATFICCPKLDV